MISKSLLLFIFLTSIILGQEYETGLLLDDSLYKDRPIAATLMRGNYDDLPGAVSLKQYAPAPGNQGPYGTCAGWATAYSARTILEALKNLWGQGKTDSNAFSPSFVYNQISTGNDCKSGTSLTQALDVLRDQGDVKLNEFEYSCDRKITALDKVKAQAYRILEYRDIVVSATKNKEKYVRKSLAEGKPVVIAIDIPRSFYRVKEVWIPDSSDYQNWSRGHAVTIVGYDDEKYGGAFEIMNSWGLNWGKKGFSWIRYSDFNFFCKYAFEVIDLRKKSIDKPDLSGSLLFKTSTGEEMKSSFNGEYFTMDKAYSSGTLFELVISNNEPAYVYAFSSDLTNDLYKIFPFSDKMVAYLPYRQNDVAIPDEESYNILDETRGKSYYCFLYSSKAVNIDSIISVIKSSDGAIWQKIKSVLKDYMVDMNDIKFDYSGKINFKAISRNKFVVPVLVEINHI
ncbi:MAG: C1 family peptidase [Ignavibacteria bacterium]